VKAKLPAGAAAALSAWESLVSNRWTFVDHIEHGGRRYLLALENEAARPSLTFLSPREREVLRRAAAGAHNKAIAYDLGLSHATVRVLISRAAHKLGVRTRVELLAFLKTAFTQGALEPFDGPASSV
jgi:DNA-binding NarL/FixJ family response regulator